MSQLVTRRTFLAVLALAGLSLGPSAFAQDGRSGKTYIALGDSVAFGYSNGPLFPPSNGDRGYVGLYADWLATQFDGKRPKVVNLAVFGESTSSFFTGEASPFWRFRVASANTNYTSEAETQHAKFLAAVRAEAAARRQVKAVSFALGANDALAVVNDPAFWAPGADQFAILEQMFGEIEANYVEALTAIRAALPHAKLLLPNYYNAFDNPNADPLSASLFEYVAARHDAMVQALAKTYKARRVDVYSAFKGHALEYTHIASENIHPNAAGYAVIAELMIAASDE